MIFNVARNPELFTHTGARERCKSFSLSLSFSLLMRKNDYIPLDSAGAVTGVLLGKIPPETLCYTRCVHNTITVQVRRRTIVSYCYSQKLFNEISKENKKM